MKIIISENQLNQIINLKENKYIVYHSTNEEFENFNFKKTAQGVVWFTDSIKSILDKNTGASGFGKILKREIILNNPAGWDEYEKYGLQELKNMGYDGAILPDKYGNDYIVFYPKSIRKLKENIQEVKKNEIIAYHGSNAEITNFIDGLVGGERANDAQGPGIYFTDNKEDASMYGKYLYTVRLTPRRILSDKKINGITRDEIINLIKLNPDWEMTAYDWDENPKKGFNYSLDSIFEEKNDKDRITQVYIEYYRYMPKEFVRNSVKIGVDGISKLNIWGDGINKSTHYIIYNPTIIQILKKEENEEVI